MKPDAIIVDLDGTLCLFGDNHPYDRDYSKDTINPVVEEILNWRDAAKGDGYSAPDIILVSGRMEKSRKQTEDWLAENHVRYSALHMRKDNDLRKDTIVKREIYDAHIKDQYNILFVLDDRNQIVKMWRELGLVCLQVADGDF